MIGRIIELYPVSFQLFLQPKICMLVLLLIPMFYVGLILQAIECFLHKDKQREQGLIDLKLTQQELGVLCDIHQVLEVAHLAQEVLSAEKTSTLALALPAYEAILINWTRCLEVIPD